MAKRFIVSPSESGGGWNIEEEGMGGEIRTATTKEEAIRMGEEMARRERGVLVIREEERRSEEMRDFTGGGRSEEDM
jgi:hypothetical protein